MTVSIEHQGDVAVITIDDSNKNVINHEVLDELEQAWRKTVEENSLQ